VRGNPRFPPRLKAGPPLPVPPPTNTIPISTTNSKQLLQHLQSSCIPQKTKKTLNPQNVKSTGLIQTMMVFRHIRNVCITKNRTIDQNVSRWGLVCGGTRGSPPASRRDPPFRYLPSPSPYPHAPPYHRTSSHLKSTPKHPSNTAKTPKNTKHFQTSP
jgi:hypothetical protein